MTVLAWEGCVNVRDLGGHVTEHGRRTVRGAVVRADSVSRLSDSGWQALTGHGVTTIVDLRFHEEREADPPRELPVDVVHVSLFGDPDPGYGAELDARMRREPDQAAYLGEIYLEFLETYRENVVAAVRAVARAAPGGVVVHCMAGKDRTGLVVALLLRLAGVPTDAVAVDYAASERNLAAQWEPWIAEAADDEERRRRRRLAETPAAAMQNVIEGLERRHGDVRAYLREGGLEEEDVERIRARLLTASGSPAANKPLATPS